jgi:hypothetical protein
MPRTKIDLERERIACVFGLGGGELHVAHPDFPDEWDGPDGIAYWYDGVPEYASELRDADQVECPDCNGDDDDCPSSEGLGHRHHEVRTALQDALFGFPDPPAGWQRIAAYSSSGEAECGWCGSGTGNEDKRANCKLCEGDGIIYLGDGWFEAIYRRLVPTW